VTHDQVVAEGSGAVGVAAVRGGHLAASDGRPVAVVVTGANIDARILGRLLSR
jgi:threonine dehydratase